MAMYKWYGEEELGMKLTNNCTIRTTLCKNGECMICQTIRKEIITWEGVIQGQQGAVQYLQEWTKKKKAVQYQGHKETKFVQAMSKWMLSNQPTRDIINQAGFEYAELWEVQGALWSKTPQIILDLQQTK